MPIDNEKIRKALDHFEDDQFTSAKEIIKKEFVSAKNDFLKGKLGLQGDLNKDKE